jgi:hypothetical protein
MSSRLSFGIFLKRLIFSGRVLMEAEMHLLTEDNILLFLLQISLLLGCARALGELFRRMGQPSITAEILVGILFGPTIFGRIVPALQAQMFPSDPVQMKMLGTVAWLGILLFVACHKCETPAVRPPPGAGHWPLHVACIGGESRGPRIYAFGFRWRVKVSQEAMS